MKIYVDMDQCIANFEKGACDLLNVALPTQPGVSLMDYFEQQGVTQNDFWSSVAETKGFWRELPRLPAAARLYKGLKRLAPIKILTSTQQLYDYAPSEKRTWLDGLGITEEMIIASDKSELASTGKLLVDDRVKHCESFVAEGGSAILFPTRETGFTSSHDEAVTFALKSAKDWKEDSEASRLYRLTD